MPRKAARKREQRTFELSNLVKGLWHVRVLREACVEHDTGRRKGGKISYESAVTVEYWRLTVARPQILRAKDLRKPKA